MGKDLKGKELGTGKRQNKNGRYEGRYIDRFGKRRSVYAMNIKELNQKMDEAIKKDIRQENVQVHLTVEQWYQIWMEHYKIPAIRANSRRHYEYIFHKHILPMLGKAYLIEVKPVDIKRLINHLSANGLQWETQNKVRILLHDLYYHAIENGYAINNPTRGLRLAAKEKKERYILSKEDTISFFRCASGTFYENLFVVAINTGMRPGEICGLEESDIDFLNHNVYVNKTLLYQKLNGDTQKEYHFEPPKTKSSTRVIPMNEACENALKNQIKLKKVLVQKYPCTSPFSNLLFVTRFNTPICSQILNDAISKIVNEINLQRDEVEQFISFSAHTFRHTFATRCIESNMSMKALQKILGHTNLQMTMDLYVHTSSEFMEEEMQKLLIDIGRNGV